MSDFTPWQILVDFGFAGLLLLVGVERGDGPGDLAYVADKLVALRVFGDDAGRMNRSLLEVGGEALVVSRINTCEQKVSNAENFTKAVETMLTKQRDSVQGVSIDEEVANLVIFQRAFQASARLITTMDALMNDVINMQT